MVEIKKFTTSEIESSYSDVKDSELQAGLRKSLQRYNEYVDWLNGLPEGEEKK